MTWRCDGKARWRCAGGFTLIELLAVLAILGVFLALVVTYRAPTTRSLDLRASAAAVASGLRLARSEAILKNRAVTFDLDLAGHRFRAGSATPQSLSPALAIELLTIAGERRQGLTGDIRFHPDGSSTGGRITLADGGRTIVVGVDWLTGRVNIADAHR